jgi:O-succinylbenzoic acid--CoA ligase
LLATPVAGVNDAGSGAAHAGLARAALALVRTSGSSGAPKTVWLSREAFLASAEASAANLGWHNDDRWLLAMPLSHVGGLSILVRGLVARACVVLRPEVPFEAGAVAAQIERDRVTLASMVPTMLVRMLDAGWRPPACLRALLLGGAGASPELLARAEDRGVPVLTTYGLTEACSQVTTQPYGTRNRGELGAGRPVRGAEVRIVDGEIQVRGPMLAGGYVDTPSPFTGDGFLRTGDLGAIDAGGNLHVLGRRDDRIVTGGENVDPVEVERALARCPGVRAACVVGVADREWGERVAALVVADGAAERDVIAWAHEHLAPRARPRVVRLVAELPLTASGKLDRAAARRVLAPGC